MNDNDKTKDERIAELQSELDEMEAIYGDHFPEPSAQLDRWNVVYDELMKLLYPCRHDWQFSYSVPEHENGGTEYIIGYVCSECGAMDTVRSDDSLPEHD